MERIEPVDGEVERIAASRAIEATDAAFAEVTKYALGVALAVGDGFRRAGLEQAGMAKPGGIENFRWRIGAEVARTLAPAGAGDEGLLFGFDQYPDRQQRGTQIVRGYVGKHGTGR